MSNRETWEHFGDDDGYGPTLDDEEIGDVEIGMDYHTGVGMDQRGIDANTKMEGDSPLEGIELADVPEGGHRRRRKVRVRPMSPAMRKHFPDVDVMNMTMRDGRQITLVRK